MSKHNLTIKTYSKSCKNASEAAAEMGMHVSQLLKTLLLKSPNRFVLALLGSDKKLNFKVINKLYDESFEMATLDEVYRITGYHIGVVSPFGLKQPIDVLIDDACLAFEIVGVGSGVRGEEIILNPHELIENKQIKAKPYRISE
jgi:Cys-tRNA(Pro)/Cys-tRNA(Cys) deacylase